MTEQVAAPILRDLARLMEEGKPYPSSTAIEALKKAAEQIERMQLALTELRKIMVDRTRNPARIKLGTTEEHLVEFIDYGLTGKPL